MWAVGCILYELLTGQNIGKVCAAGLGSALNADVKAGVRVTVVATLLCALGHVPAGERPYAVDLLSLLEILFAHDPKHRPAAHEVSEWANGERTSRTRTSLEILNAIEEMCLETPASVAASLAASEFLGELGLGKLALI
jgi:hypothetical protein